MTLIYTTILFVFGRSDGNLETNQCGETAREREGALVMMSGTSQATPFAAGAAAIVRQYFGEGRLMNGIRDTLVAVPFSPSAALIKVCQEPNK